MSTPRFREQLRRQLCFIRNSCEIYDRGDRAEAIRIGTSLRVILHDTRSSISLLKHLGATDVPLLSTVPKLERTIGRRRVLTAETLTFTVSSSGPGFMPPLGASATKTYLPAPEWWEQTVTIVSGDEVSRRLLVLAAANNDGGAHVDSHLPPVYQQLVDGVWADMATGEALVGHQLGYLRQLGYEILNSPDLTALAR